MSLHLYSQCLVWIFYNIKNEMQHFITIRQQHLIERTHSKSVQANSILVTGIPSKYLTQDALFKLFGSLPGGVKKIWINRCVISTPFPYYPKDFENKFLMYV